MPQRKDSQNALSTPPDGGIHKADLPPSRPRKKALTRVDAPLTNLSLNNLIYILSLLSVALIAWYSWRIVGYKREVGGWWNLALGKKAHASEPSATGWFSHSKADKGTGEGRGGGNEVEERINALAAALGMPPTHLASAIASAVREHVPPASLSSVAASEPTGAATKVLVNDEGEEGEAQESEGVTASGVLGSMVGMDEPPE
ncbi:hypothetical protein FIBSPDRAFT_909408 [Athelia psychrophila]|uniref:Uncharacterized protein n=1 Tax=Athelia psychrophila TaxID=1759441 RepID=A0A166P9Q7_9AGAM|nr:hypothetical protein FIBSPDRAFT_909408 [Fibularhizoctonia sp. CBS 109695]